MPRRSRLWLRLLICLFVGTTLNVAVAWLLGCCATPTSGFDQYAADGAGWPASTPAGWPEPDYWGNLRGLGFTLVSASNNLEALARTQRKDPTITVHSLQSRRYGLPFRSMQTRTLAVQTGRVITPMDPGPFRAGLDLPSSWNPINYPHRRIPLQPLFPGFALNSFLYALLAAGLWTSTTALRRRSRQRKQLCPACAYPIGASPTCTECGRTLSPSAGSLRM
jgi:hypothetical protein